jgi:hypothetical protein
MPQGDMPNPDELAARRARAVQLRISGLSYQQIAQQVPEYRGNRATAFRDIKDALAQAREHQAADLEELRQIEDERDDDLRRRLFAIMARPHYVVQNGKMINGPDGQPLRDDMMVLQAIDRLDRIGIRFARRHGLDQPEKIEIALSRRTDVEASLVVEAILAASSSAGLAPEQRMRMLEAAQAHLTAVDGEVVSETED